MKITNYFEGTKIKEALKKYKDTKTKKWLVSHKLDLYQAGNIAFDSSYSEDERKEKFEEIYNDKGWGVFRKGERSTSGEIFDSLTKECSECSRKAGLTLANLKDGQDCDALIKCLNKIKDIKTLKSGRVSTTAISKFLHFFNPKLFPLYNEKDIEKGVLKIFGKEWKDFTPAVHSESPYCGIRTYFRYILWANQIIRQNHKKIMGVFMEWVEEQVGPKNDLDFLKDYYATAFEFIAIGASLIEEDSSVN